MATPTEDVIEYTTVALYSKINTGASIVDVKVRLMSDSVTYKESTVINAETITLTPDMTTGLVEFSLVETENMSGTNYYTFDLGDKSYKAQVPNVGEISFNDLNLIKTNVTL